MKILEYRIGRDQTSVLLPTNARVLAVKVRDLCPCIYVQVDTNNPLVKSKLYIIHEEETLPKEAEYAEYLGTVIIDDETHHFFLGETDYKGEVK